MNRTVNLGQHSKILIVFVGGSRLALYLVYSKYNIKKHNGCISNEIVTLGIPERTNAKIQVDPGPINLLAYQSVDKLWSLCFQLMCDMGGYREVLWWCLCKAMCAFV